MTFALTEDGVLRHVDEVPNGLACQCICPGCSARLVAKHGSKTMHHFAHEGGSDCAGGVETSLHLAAKEILSRKRNMKLPEVASEAIATDSAGINHSAKRSFPSAVVNFTEVYEEVRLGQIIPDLVAIAGGRRLLIEVAVTHFVDENKLALIKEMGVAAIEVDLSNLSLAWDWDSLEDALLRQTNNKTWLSNPKQDYLHAAAMVDAKSKATKANREYLASSRRIKQSHDFQRASIPGYQVAHKQLRAFLNPVNMNAEKLRMDEAGRTHEVWLHLSKALGIDWETPPYFVNIEVPGEMGIPIDRRVWQAAVFNEFVFNYKGTYFLKEDVAKCCINTFGWRSEFSVLNKRDHRHLLTRDELEGMPFAMGAVSCYLKELEKLGLIKANKKSYTVLADGMLKQFPDWRRPR